MRGISTRTMLPVLFAVALLLAPGSGIAETDSCEKLAQYPLSSISNRYAVPGTVQDLIATVARLERLDEDLLLAVMCVESSGNPSALSEAGAIGLLQVLPATAVELGITDSSLLTDPWINLRVGARYLSHLISRSGGDLHKAIQAYHAGFKRVEGGEVGLQTKRYVQRVLAIYQLRKHNANRRESRKIHNHAFVFNNIVE